MSSIYMKNIPQWGKTIKAALVIIIPLSIIFGFIFIVSIIIPYITPHKTIKVGIIHSQTGPLAVSELPLIDATILAIDEINKQGGLLSSFIDPIVVDAQSDPRIFAQEAERLINTYKVQVIFGCWTSASRKAVKPIVEKYNNILFYPVQYEGLEQSLHIVYTGATATQQLIPGANWCYFNLGKKFYLVGSDYVYPRIANLILQKHIQQLGGQVVGQSLISFDKNNIEKINHVIEDISQTNPDVILNTINGIDNMIFFKLLRNKGITAAKIPTMSFSISTPEIVLMDQVNFVGDYLCWSYFQNIPSKENRHFIESFRNKYGSQRFISDPMEAAYCSVILWKQAVEQASTTHPSSVLEMIKEQGMNAPEGVIFVDPATLHLWKFIRIGKITQNGLCDIIWDSKKPLQPSLYPPYESKEFWDNLVKKISEE